jgi:hypothetical protein
LVEFGRGVDRELNSGITFHQELFDTMKVSLGVDADGVVFSWLDIERNSIFQEAKLFETFGALEDAGGERGK